MSSSSDRDYTKALSGRQVQMIAIGGAIGVGLFLGAGGKLQQAGPSLLLSYALCGVAGYFVMRALGELVLYQPSSGSFVTYARKFIGPWAGFASGWMYWLYWATTGIAEITAVAIYVHKWLPDIPQWVTALAALGVLLLVNLLSVKLFGELEFWFSLVKVLAIVVFLVVGLGLVLTSAQIGETTAGAHNLIAHDGFFPSGFGITLMTLQAVIFAYAGIELVGITAGETQEPGKVVPKAVNSVVWRIGVFYVGSVLLLAMLVPWPFYSSGESPFVTVFTRLGIPAVGDVMNAIVLTAALSSCNSGLYSTGRILRALSEKGEAPEFAGRMNKHHVPYGGILFTCSAYVLGVVLNYLVPKQAFDITTAIASFGVVSTWATLIVCQMRLRQASLRGELERPRFRMPGAPYTGWATLGFLALVIVLMGFSDGAEKIAFYSMPAIVIVLVAGWRAVGRRRDRLSVPG
ncbi:amino acid permease [Amycolatopsis keratiniphila]|uniref:amino acid permease n=1 Tax=Amycolatopsis keratiniphila TaxID=129921 RepID=UPI00087ACCDF|nr:amino acid permease [Amycolatopsis keratiniphila]OLZ47255.1 L-asparagine permease [Amycolatopsis keratiniphila subsp. nogabecina]SDU38693.1 D-serine/D-alanine/glycine:proton symporter, AAT family [Amycolatopsis keratiniphila]